MLDHSRPCDEVFGIPGVKWSQDGCLYNTGGRPVTYRWEKTGEKDGSGDPQDRLVITLLDDAPAAVPAAKTLEAKTLHTPDSYDTMDWRHLKAMLSQYGEEYTSKEAAIAFLRGEKVAAGANPGGEDTEEEAPDDRPDLAKFRGETMPSEPALTPDR